MNRFKTLLILTSILFYSQLFSQEYAIIKNKNLFEIYKSGKKLSKTSFLDAKQLPDNYFCVKDKNKYGILSPEGKLIISDNFDNILYFSKDLFLVKQNSKWGLINHRNTTILPTEYVDFRKSENNLYKIKGNNGTGFINEQGVVLIPPIYEDIDIFSNNAYKVRKDGKIGLINDLGDEIIPVIYKNIYPLDNSRLYVGEMEDKQHIIDLSRRQILDHNFDEIDTSYGSFLVLKKDSRIGFYINNTFTPIVYDRIVFYQPNQGVIAVKQGNKYGLILGNGKIIPAIYDNISRFNGGVAFAEKNGRLININIEGKEINL